MEYFDNILCVTYKELLDIMPKGTLNSQLSREKLDVVSRGGGENNPALYAYSSLPEKYKKRWVERHGEPEKQMRQEMIRNIVKKDEKAENFFEDYRYDKNGEMASSERLPGVSQYEFSPMQAIIISTLRAAATAFSISGSFSSM